MTSQTTSLTKLSAAIVAVALVTGSLFALATQRAHAVTLSELVELFIALEIIEGEKADQARAVVAQQTPTPGTPAAGGLVCPATPFTGTMSQGASSQQVLDLQKFLNSVDGIQVAASGAGSVGNETMFFGPATRAAVVAFQNKYAAEVLTPLGLSAGTGFAGSATITKINALCAAPTTPGTPGVPGAPGEPTEPTTPTTPTLGGGEGYLDFDVVLESDVEIDLGEADNPIEFELEAKDSDIMVNRADFMFNARPWLYFDEVNLLVDGEEVASLSSSGDFTQVGSNYRARFAGLNEIIEEDETAEFALELVVLSSLPGDRADDTVRVWVPVNAVRAVDGAGLDQYAPSVTVPDAVGNPADTDEAVAVTFEDTFGDGDIAVAISDNSPENATIVLNETSRTDGVAVLYFDVEAEDSDVEVTDVKVGLAIGSSTIPNMVYRARLYVGNTLLATESVTTATTTFDDLEFDISKDDTEEFRVELEFERGDKLSNDLTDTATFTVVGLEVLAENSDFSALDEYVEVGEVHTVLVQGLTSDLNDVTVTKANDGKQATITFVLDVTANGQDFWISEVGGTAFDATVEGPGTTVVGTSTVTVSGVTKNASSNFRIQKGTTREVSISYIVTDTTGGFITGQLDTLHYGTAATTATGKELDLGVVDYAIPSGTSVVAL